MDFSGNLFRPFWAAVLIAFACPLPVLFGSETDSARESLQRRQKAEVMSFYLGEPQVSDLPKTPMAVELYNDAAEYFQKGEYLLARQALTDSLGFDGRNPYAYVLLGDMEMLDGRSDKAIENYKKAFSLNPLPQLRVKLERLMKEQAVDQTSHTLQDRHFVLQYPDGVDHRDLFLLRYLAKKSYRHLSQTFGYSFQQPLIIKIQKSDDFHDLTGLPQWVGGAFDFQIRIPYSSGRFQQEELDAMIRHEMTHAFVAAISGWKAPSWIHEGLALYEENQVKLRDLLVFDAAVKTGTLIPILQLINEKKVIEAGDPLWASLFYDESFRFTAFLVEKFGMFKMKSVLSEFSRGMNSETALRNVLSQSVSELENEWKKSITG